MKRLLLMVIALALGVLACTKATPTPTLPTLLTPNTPKPTPTATPPTSALGSRISVVQASALEVREFPNETAPSYGAIPNGTQIEVIACRWVDGNLWVEHRWDPTGCTSDKKLCALGWSAGVWQGEVYLAPLGMCDVR